MRAQHGSCSPWVRVACECFVWFSLSFASKFDNCRYSKWKKLVSHRKMQCAWELRTESAVFALITHHSPTATCKLATRHDGQKAITDIWKWIFLDDTWLGKELNVCRTRDDARLSVELRVKTIQNFSENKIVDGWRTWKEKSHFYLQQNSESLLHSLLHIVNCETDLSSASATEVQKTEDKKNPVATSCFIHPPFAWIATRSRSVGNYLHLTCHGLAWTHDNTAANWRMSLRMPWSDITCSIRLTLFSERQVPNGIMRIENGWILCH